MARPTDIYSVATGLPIYGGKSAPGSTFDSVINFIGPANSGVPTAGDASKVLTVTLHGSSGSDVANGRQYRAAVSGYMAVPGTSPNFGSIGYDNRSTFGFEEGQSYPSTIWPDYINVKPVDYWIYDDGGDKIESMHMGWLMPDGRFHLYSERRYDTMIDWLAKNRPYNMNKLCLAGGSMGGWGSATYGLKRASKFAAIYPDRPRWMCNTSIYLPVWSRSTPSSYTRTTAPLLAPEDGGGNTYDYFNSLAFINNTTNKLPWIGWCAGRQDGYAGAWQDQITILNALIATKRGFAFYWNNGGHDGSSSPDKLYFSYPFGTFDKTKGYPRFSAFSRDQDPNIHIAGGINIGLTFRNVVESANSWSCEVTCLTPTTVTGNVFAGNPSLPASPYQTYSATTTTFQLPTSESEIPDVYVGGTVTINGETRTISAYQPVGIDPTYSSNDIKSPAIVTVSSAFSSAPAANAAYSITRPDISCTVQVDPISDVFKQAVTTKTVTIPNTGNWQLVQFP